MALLQQQSSAAIFYQELVGQYQQKELVDLQRMDKILTDKNASKKSGGMGAAVSSAEQIREWRIQLKPIEELELELETRVKSDDPTDNIEFFGLTVSEASDRLKRDGPNQLTEKVGTPWYIAFLKEITNFFSILLWIGAAMCFIAYGLQADKTDQSNLYLGVVLVCVVLITGIFSYSQQSKAASLMAQFKNFIPAQTQVIRGGIQSTVGASALVKGDIVFISSGNNIPADVILIKTAEMKVNNASLTGESEDLIRNTEKKVENIFETGNVAFFGTNCTAGEGYGIVFKTGDETVIGKIANLAQSSDSMETTLNIEINRFIILISSIAITFGVAFFIIGEIIGYDVIVNLIFAIGFIVANMPEGLLGSVTVCLALTAKRMAAKMVLVKNMQSVETLGSTSCICSDKTGTLTQNRMTVSHMFYDLKNIDVSYNKQKYDNDKAANPNGPDLGYDPKEIGFKRLLETIILGTTAQFEDVPEDVDVKKWIAKTLGKKNISSDDLKLHLDEAVKALTDAEKGKKWLDRRTKGDASESGLIKFARALKNKELEDYRDTFPVFQYEDPADSQKKINCAIPFSSDIKFNLAIRHFGNKKKETDPMKKGFRVIMKGAPERILSRCDKILIKGVEEDFTPQRKEEVEAANKLYGGTGERVLAFAQISLDPKVFTKDPPYQFDVPNWKNFKNVHDRDEAFKYWFPMSGLTLIGLCSLNDPPRLKVDLAVDKCRSAGIKVIMVTGDQPATAAAIANKVNILKHPDLEYNFLVQKYLKEENDKQIIKKEDLKQKMNEIKHKAFSNATGIVIHGDKLAKKHQKEDTLDEQDPEKGRYLLDWISKDEVVFARTTPSQKLLIVDACQRAGHIVAVTGDGVNDSPAIKKADIGIAMGSGSDVAKNAADMILLDDNFCSIVNGIEEGRLIFDNLKKVISYSICVNIAEIGPYVLFVVFAVPVPLSTVLMLAICIGTDIVPAISFAYENAELDIMERFPRNAKRDRLVTARLIGYSYLQIGQIENMAGFFTYFYVMNDYGIKISTTIHLSAMSGFIPADTDLYNPNEINYGNSNYNDPSFVGSPNWGRTEHNTVDIRLIYPQHTPKSWSRCRWDSSNPNIPMWYYSSFITHKPICYTSEACINAQSAVFLALLCVQYADLLIVKTRSLSLSQHQYHKNWVTSFSICFETAVAIILVYVPGVNTVLNTRPVPPPHCIVPAFSFFVLMYFYDELRKIYLRSGIEKDKVTGRIIYTGWVARNTYY